MYASTGQNEAGWRAYTRHTDYVGGLVVLPDGILASGSDDRTIKIWNTVNGNNIRTLFGHTKSVYGLVVLPDRTLASCESHYIIIWNWIKATSYNRINIYNINII